MKKINNFLDATYLKSIADEHVTESEYKERIIVLLKNAIQYSVKCVMIRPEYVAMAKQYFLHHKSQVLVGTVIDFPFGTATLKDKLTQATEAISNGTDELDFVINYEAYKNGEVNLVQQEVKECTALCLQHHKTVKWIIETAALTNDEIVKLTTLIKNVVIRNFKETAYSNVFIKTSTGVYITQNNMPSGATPLAVMLMLENATPLSVKASGGIKDLQTVLFYLQMGVKRIGTSSQMEILSENTQS